jgi:hypothetical protein
MTFDQTRNHTAPVEVDFPGIPSRSVEHISVSAYGDKPITPDRNCLYIRVLIPHRNDFAVVVNCVGTLSLGYRGAERYAEDPKRVCDGAQERTPISPRNASRPRGNSSRYIEWCVRRAFRLVREYPPAAHCAWCIRSVSLLALRCGMAGSRRSCG